MSRNTATLSVVVAALLVGSVFASSALAGRGGGKKTAPDTTRPLVAITTPGSGAELAGSVSVGGTAFDNTKLARVEVSVDGGAFALAAGTTSWSHALDTRDRADGPHTITARAVDAAGNTTVTNVSVSFKNATSPPPPPPPPSDTTPPVVFVDFPGPGAALSGSVWISGRASDETALSQVDVSVDGGPFRPAGGTGSWRHLLDTTGYTNGSHSITARATDSAGNTSATTVSVTIGNAPTSPGPSEQLVTPEGATIQIYPDADGWTAQGVYELLRANALELGRLGPSLTVKVQTTYPSATTSSASQSGGVYGNYRATMYLQAGPNTTFTLRPDFIMAHEYGHAWSNYHLYISHQGDWSSYLTARGIAGDARLDSTYNWSKSEMLADDYRMLFGTPAALAQASYINPAVADPRSVPGLGDFLLLSWALP